MRHKVHTERRPARLPRHPIVLAAALCAAALTLPAPALAATPGPPVVSSASFSEVTETAATLAAGVDPDGREVTDAHFRYIPLSAYEADGEAFGEGTLATAAQSLPAEVEGSGRLTEGSTALTGLITTAGTFAPGQSLTGTGIAAGTTIKAVDLKAGTLTLSKPATATLTAAQLTATGPQPITAAATGLSPGTAYRLRVFAENAKGTVEGPEEVTLTTLTAPQAFGPCPNEELRSGGPHVQPPPGDPSALLPDCRAYEQASPVEKDGADALISSSFARGASQGQGAIFSTDFGLPGGSGAPGQPSYVASSSGADWTTRGLFAPASLGQESTIFGWLPDLGASFASAGRLTPTGDEKALFELHPTSGAPPTQITPYEPGTLGAEELFAYAGASADGSTVVFEARAALPAEAGGPPLPGAASHEASNVYAYDQATGRLSLASVMNTEAQTEAELPKGAFAGPYDWARGTSSVGQGGSSVRYYTQAERAIAADGSVFFTAAGSGQLYERLNPTAPQSAVVHAGEAGEECTEPEKACTLHVSASEKDNGQGPGGTDPAGPQPAAFMAASEDGSLAFFTSPEKLTDDADTGPEQPPAQIGRAVPGPTRPEEVEGSFLPAHALGLTASPDGGYLYWADPADHSIGRQKIDPATGAAEGPAEPDFIVPAETECESRPEEEPGVLHSAPAAPRYVAVDAEHVYWTNTGPLGEGGHAGGTTYPEAGCGTIGRAELDSEANLLPGSVEAEFISGAFNPEGIAANESHIYWADAATPVEEGRQAIGRAKLNGGGPASEVEEEFLGASGQYPQALTLTENYLYIASDQNGQRSNVLQIPLEGGERKTLLIGAGGEEHPGIRGIALIGEDVYWAQSEEDAIGRVPVSEIGAGECFNPASKPNCEREYLKLPAGPFGLAAAAGHLYWSVNGESPTNPGTDLYRFDAQAPPSRRLTDLTPDPADPDGAEVQGVLGASADGSYVYFVADGVLASNEGALETQAQPGTCHTSPAHGPIVTTEGSCNLYLDHEGQIEYLAPLDTVAGGSETASDALDWTPGPELFGGGATKAPSSALGAGGRVLLFNSAQQLTAYANHGVPELYRHQAGDPRLTCVSCNPSGEAPTGKGGPSTLPQNIFVGSRPRSNETAATTVRFLSADGERAFFETTEALVGADTDGRGGCTPLQPSGGPPLSCEDAYEWEAPGTGSCTEAASAWSPQDEGCLYLLAPGGGGPSFFADADEEGEDVYVFTRDRLVGQDTDSLYDVYDARVGGGLASQSPPAPEGCEAEACKSGPPSQVPEAQTPASAHFQGAPNPTPRPCRKGQVRRGDRCVAGHHHRKKAHHRRHRRDKGGDR